MNVLAKSDVHAASKDHSHISFKLKLCLSSPDQCKSNIHFCLTSALAFQLLDIHQPASLFISVQGCSCAKILMCKVMKIRKTNKYNFSL